MDKKLSKERNILAHIAPEQSSRQVLEKWK